jgi:CreA protein
MRKWIAALLLVMLGLGPAALAASEDRIFDVDTAFKFLGRNHKIAMYGIDDPLVQGVTCHFSAAETGGIKGSLGLAEDTSDASIACRQVGPIRFTGKFRQGDEVYQKSRSFLFKKLNIVRGCDAKRNVLIYVVYSDRLIEGSPKNAISTVPVQPWGGGEAAPRCADFVR